MTVGEMKKYLSEFDESELFVVVVADTKKRLHYIPAEEFALAEFPAILVDTHETEPLDDAMERLGDELNEAISEQESAK